MRPLFAFGLLALAPFALASLGPLTVATGAAQAAGCGPGPDGRARTGPDCPAARREKIEPYDPDRAKAGSRPGFIDLGNGTEVRVGGRARLDYDVRR